MTFRNIVLLSIVVVLSSFIVPGALAHGSKPRLEINLERINPGGVLDVRGVEFDYEQFVTLYLERKGIVVQIGEVFTDQEGGFVHIVALPSDLPEGVYNVRAVTTHHDVLSPALTVQGPAILKDAGGQGEREEDDGLLAPMPTFAPGVSSTPLPKTVALENQATKQHPTTLIYSIGAGVAILALLGIRILRKR